MVIVQYFISNFLMFLWRREVFALYPLPGKMRNQKIFRHSTSQITTFKPLATESYLESSIVLAPKATGLNYN